MPWIRCYVISVEKYSRSICLFLRQTTQIEVRLCLRFLLHLVANHRLLGVVSIPSMPNVIWPRLQVAAITAPDTYRPLLMPGTLANGLPLLRSLDLNHLSLQAWTQPQPTVTSLVVHNVRKMGREFQELLQLLPELRSLTVWSDMGALRQGRTEPLLRRPVVLNRLCHLEVRSSHFYILTTFRAPALRHLYYTIFPHDSQNVVPISTLSEVRAFITSSNLSARLQTLRVRVESMMPVEATVVHDMLDGLLQLQHLVLGLGTEQPYHALQQLDLPALRTAAFRVVDVDSALDIIAFARVYRAVRSVKVLWGTDESKVDLFVGHDVARAIGTEFQRQLAVNNGWRRVGSGRYFLDR